MEIAMKTMFLAVAATLGAFGRTANAKAGRPDGAAIQETKAEVPAGTDHSSQASDLLRLENPTGLSSYEMRRYGLMINGLPPVNGWLG
jgi:hypothetical protein